jgi:diguanylate cyclase (GGDEF)-like protein
MTTIGRKLEDGIEALFAISTEIADLQSNYDNVIKDLSMYHSLIEIQKYLGSGLELYELLPSIEDVIAGVFGTNWCKIIIDNSDLKNMPVETNLNLEKLNEFNMDNLRADEHMKKTLFGLDGGELIIMRFNLIDNEFGYIIIYWGFPQNITNNMIRFLELLKSQLEISVQNAQLINKFKTLSVKDPLTGIYNRAYFNNLISNTNPNTGDSIILFDIDNFKKVNDTMGHTYGDCVLKDFATILKENCTENAMAIRYGGEEFVIVCFGESDAERLADSVRKIFEEKTSYTVSAGVAYFMDSCTEVSFQKLCERADFAMYLSKQNGKNRTTVFQTT